MHANTFVTPPEFECEFGKAIPYLVTPMMRVANVGVVKPLALDNNKYEPVLLAIKTFLPRYRGLQHLMEKGSPQKTIR